MFHRIPYPPIPPDTAQAASSLYGKGNVYLKLGDDLDKLLLELIPGDIKLPDSNDWVIETCIQYALLTIIQFAEELNNQQIVEALRSRMDLKYALHLPINYHRMDPTDLCEFRRQLFAHVGYQDIFQNFLDRIATLGFLNSIQEQPVQTMQVLISVCTLTRFSEVVDAMNRALEALAVTNPDWLRQAALPFWYDRYSPRTIRYSAQSSEKRRKVKAQEIAADIHYLLGEIDKARLPVLESLPEINALRRIWVEQFDANPMGAAHKEDMQWRLTRCASCSQKIDQLKEVQ